MQDLCPRLVAPSYEEVQKQVADILKGRILVGHAVQNDLKVRLQLASSTDTRRDHTECPCSWYTGPIAVPSGPADSRHIEVRAAAGARWHQASFAQESFQESLRDRHSRRRAFVCDRCQGNHGHLSFCAEGLGIDASRTLR